MKAISIWQPWASLIVIGAKQFETRCWATKYRGKIAIHAAKKLINNNEISFPMIVNSIKCLKDKGIDYLNMPYGAIIGTAELVNCWRIVYHPGTNVDIAKHISIGAELDVPKNHPDFARYIVPSEKEMLLGHWIPGRYAWELTNVVMFEEPIPCKGQQRLWNWDGVE